MTSEQTSPNGHLLTPEQLEQAKEYIFRQLPQVLVQSPEFVIFVEGIVAEKFPRRDEFARLLDEVQTHRQETQQLAESVGERFGQVESEIQAHRQETRQFQEDVDNRFEQVDSRFEQVESEIQAHRRETRQFQEEVVKRFERLETRMEDGFQDVFKHMDRLGARWGIRNGIVFRKTMRTLFEESFGVTVEERHIGGEQYDIAIHNGDHILIEIAASVGPNIQERLVRKREKYIAATGVTPTRSILAVGSVSRNRFDALVALGFEVVEPDDDYE